MAAHRRVMAADKITPQSENNNIGIYGKGNNIIMSDCGRKKNLRSFMAVIILVLITTAPGITLPQAVKNGDYPQCSHIYWEVTDKDPEGLNGRLATDFPSGHASPSSIWPEGPISRWPVVRKFHCGSILTAFREPPPAKRKRRFTLRHHQ